MNRNILSIIIITILFTSCSSSKEININQLAGTWVETQSSDLYESDEIHEVSFFVDGTYQNRVYNKKDSLISNFDGTYEIDLENVTIKMTNSGYTLKDMNLIELTETNLNVEIVEYAEGKANLSYRKK